MKKCVLRILRLKPKSTEQQPFSTSGAESAAMVNHQLLKVEKREQTEEIILKLAHKCAFPFEVGALQMIQRGDHKEKRQVIKAKKSELKRTSALYRLDPELDHNGLMPFRDRLGKSQ